MPAVIKTTPRVFRFGATEIPDPLPNATPERCLQVLRVHYPTFANADVEGPAIEHGRQVYTIKVNVGTKG